MSHQQLILRANRYLSATLLEMKLVSSEDVAKANSKLLGNLQGDNRRNSSILGILIYDLKAVTENAILDKTVGSSRIGLVNLDSLKIDPTLTEGLDIEACWSTFTIPFTTLGKATCIASCYYLSKPVRDFWEEKYEKVIWYGTTLSSIGSRLESLETAKSG